MPTPTLTVPWYSQGEVPFPATTDAQACVRSFLFMFKAFLMNQLVGAAPVGGGFPTTGAQTQMVVGDLLTPSAVPAAL